ncbi:type II secretion system protein N [Caldimonas sp. KR1-144]|uniref:type II secretion system protein N n=1 Tax=Caldimonas sp. KR1-144 TaxID=3400911 RepID=UPI003C080CD6
MARWTERLSRFHRRGAGAGATAFGESRFEDQRWRRAEGAARRFALWGGLLGVVVALIVWAPAAWLAGWVADATGGRVLLAEARGTIWNGSAVAVLAGGSGSREARALPGRLRWTLRPAGAGFSLMLEHACCLNGRTELRLSPGFGSMTTRLVAAPVQPDSGGQWIGQWPAQWLAGLGTPFNTLQLGGALRLTTPPSGLTLRQVQGRWLVEGGASLELIDVSSRLSSLERLGSYRLDLAGDPASGGARLDLATLDGALQLSGNGQLGANGLRFRGEARADGDPAALSNLLNIIGRRDGARSVISIG